MREKNRKPIANNRKKLPQFTTMNVIDGQAGLVNYSSLIFYSLTIDNILNIIIPCTQSFKFCRFFTYSRTITAPPTMQKKPHTKSPKLIIVNITPIFFFATIYI